MRLLDLFSGIGGFSLAARWMGWETIQFVEKDEFCQKVLTKNFKGVPIHGDIKTYEPDAMLGVDIISGGSPCQPFSCAGKRRGVEDDRALWCEMLRIIKIVKPRWVLFENVAGIVSMELDNVLADLEGEGYEARTLMVPSCGVNAPQKRDRVWVIANRNQDGDYRRRVEEGGDSRNGGRSETVGGGATVNAERPCAFDNRRPIAYLRRRGDDGIPRRVDTDKGKRIAALGNAIVPQVAYEIFLAIDEADNKFYKNTCENRDGCDIV